MSRRCMKRARINTDTPPASLLLLLALLVLQFFTIVVSARAVSELDLSQYVGEELSRVGHSGVIPVPSNHTFKNLCSNRLVRMLPKRQIDATGQSMDRYSELLITSASFGFVWIQNARNKKFLCFNKKGKLKIRHSKDEQCIFEELYDAASSQNTYMYRSYKYNDFYLGFNKAGKKMKGHLPTHRTKQLCYKFMKSSGRTSIKTKAIGEHGPHYGVDADFHKVEHPRRHSRHRRKSEVT